MQPKAKRYFGVSSVFFLLAASGCGRSIAGSGLNEAAPGGQEQAVNGSSEAGQSIGEANSSLVSDEYLRPAGKPFEWTESMTEDVLRGLAPACPGSSTNQQGTVAFAVAGNCQEFSVSQARQQIGNVGALYAKQGTNLLTMMATEAQSINLQTTPAAVPAIDLGKVVGQQNAAGQAESSQGATSALMLDDAPHVGGGDGWEGGGRNYTVGSSQFSATTTGYFYVKHKNGVGVRSSADLTGKAFSIQRSLVYAKLNAEAFTLGQRGEVGLQVQVFGQDAYSQSYQEPEIHGERNLLSLNHTFPGQLNFAIGPVPFSVTWSFHVTGGVPVTYTLRPTSVAGGIKPNAGASVGLEGGADIQVAKAGVEGNLNILSAEFNSSAEAALSTNGQGTPSVCYTAVVDLSLKNILGGSLMAFVQVGRPDVKIFRIPLGWRGSLKFVDWEGTNYNLPIVNANGTCLAASA